MAIRRTTVCTLAILVGCFLAALLPAACSGGAATISPTEEMSSRPNSELVEEEPQAETLQVAATTVPEETLQVAATTVPEETQQVTATALPEETLQVEATAVLVETVPSTPDVGDTNLCTKERSMKLLNEQTHAEQEAWQARYAADWPRMQDVLNKHRALFEGYPNFDIVGVSAFLHVRSSGWWEQTEDYGIVLNLTEEVDPDTLPEDKRIPDCLDGVPVRIYVGLGFQPYAGGAKWD